MTTLGLLGLGLRLNNKNAPVGAQGIKTNSNETVCKNFNFYLPQKV